MTPPWYTDAGIWSALIALLALVLSQLPPVKTWGRKGRLAVELHDRVTVGQYFGLPSLQTYISVRNVGQRAVRIRKLNFQVTNDAGAVFLLKIDGHFVSIQAEQPVVLFPFTVGPDGEWGHLVNGNTELSTAAEKLLGDMKSEIVLSLQQASQAYAAWKAGPRDTTPPAPVANTHSMERARAEFEKNFRWAPGEYHLQVSLEGDMGTARSPLYRFTVFDWTTTELKDQLDGYAIGRGLLPNLPPQGVTCKLRATN